MLDKVRCMLSNAKLSSSLREEAATMACFLINRCSSAGLEFKTPMKIYSGKPADYQTLGFFYVCEWKKNNARSTKSEFLGYPERTKGYRVWIAEDGICKAMISRDITFYEENIL